MIFSKGPVWSTNRQKSYSAGPSSPGQCGLITNSNIYPPKNLGWRKQCTKAGKLENYGGKQEGVVSALGLKNSRTRMFSQGRYRQSCSARVRINQGVFARVYRSLRSPGLVWTAVCMFWISFIRNKSSILRLEWTD